MSKKEKLKELINFYGNQVELAKTLRVQKANITHWLNSGEMPANRAIEIEILTKGKFKAVELSGGDNE